MIVLCVTKKYILFTNLIVDYICNIWNSNKEKDYLSVIYVLTIVWTYDLILWFCDELDYDCVRTD